MAAKTLPLCLLADIPDGTARGFELPGPDGPIDIFVVLRGGAATGFVNSCRMWARR